MQQRHLVGKRAVHRPVGLLRPTHGVAYHRQVPSSSIGLTGRSGPGRRRRARSHLLGLTVDEDWSMLGAQLADVAAPALVVLDGEPAITTLAQRLWPNTPIQRCWWHLPHGLRKAFYADDAANRHVNPRWARSRASELGELLRAQIRAEHTPAEALTAWDDFTTTIPATLTRAQAYLAAARPHAFTCLDPALRRRLAHLGGPELAPAFWNGSCANSTPAPTSAAAAGPCPASATCSPFRPLACSVTPPGKRSSETPTSPVQSHPACSSSTVRDATQGSARVPAGSVTGGLPAVRSALGVVAASRVPCRLLAMEDGCMPKKFDPEVKARAVRMVRDHLSTYGSVTATAAVVGSQLGISENTLRRWVIQADVDDGRREGVPSEVQAELARLQAENKRLRETNEILRRASIFFAGELDPHAR